MAKDSAVELDYRPSYAAAAVVGVLALLLYVITLAPTTSMWDTSEYITAAYTLGIPHPPGNPRFVLLGRLFAILPIAPSVAQRVNLLAALCGAASAAVWFLVTERVLVSWFPARWQRIAGGAIAAIIGATAFTDWNQSVVNEKVYTVALLGIAIISWLMIRWSDEPDGRFADRLLVLVAYLCSLGYGVHMAGMLAAPAVAVAVLVRRPQTILRWRLLLAIGAALVMGLTPFATQPIRAAFFPPENEGEPTACRDGLHVSCTFSKGTYDAFMYNFNRGQYGKPSISERQAPFIQGQVAMWWYYFKWQWLRDPWGDHPATQSILAALFFVLGLFGAWVHFQRERRSFWYFGTFMFTTTLLLIYYLNFKYGNTQPSDNPQIPREVRDRDYFFIWSFSAWGVWASLGLVYIWESVASFFGTEKTKIGKDIVTVPSNRALQMGSPVLLVALIPLFTNWHWASRAGQTDTRDFAHDLLDSVEPYGVLVTVGDNDTFPLWYAQEVEGIRKDVVVANTSLLNTDWYGRQMLRRPVYDYDEAKGPAVYRGKHWDTALARGPAQHDPRRSGRRSRSAAARPEDELRCPGHSRHARSRQHQHGRPAEGGHSRAAHDSGFVAAAPDVLQPDGRGPASVSAPARPRATIRWSRASRGRSSCRPRSRAPTPCTSRMMAEAGTTCSAPRRSLAAGFRGAQIPDPPRQLDRRAVEGIPYLYFITGIHLDAALQAVHDPTDAHTVYTQMAGVAHMIRYDRSVPPESANLAAELVAPLGTPDTAKAKTDSAHAKTTAPKKNPPTSP